MTQLITLEGKKRKMGHEFSLLKLMGNEGPSLLTENPWNLSDEEAGVQFLYQVAVSNPGITWGDLFDLSRKYDQGALGWNPFKGLGRKIKNLNADTWDFVGKHAGSAVRLLTDKEVVSGLSQYGAAYATGGTSMAAGGIFGGLLGGEEASGILGMLGKNQKVNYAATGGGNPLAGIPPAYLAIGGGALLLMLMMMMSRR